VNRGDGNWAEISPDGIHRYALHRKWGDGPVLGWIMLNPSTAGVIINDQTVRQVMHFSRREGYGACWAGNLFSLRSPSPDVLRESSTRTGPLNGVWLRALLAEVPEVVLAWGANGGEPWAQERRDEVRAMIAEYGVTVSCLGTTASGEPRHPCRLPRTTPLTRFDLPRGAPGVLTGE
jgi:hypothetical protein